MTHTAVVVGGNRTPFAKAGTKFADASAQDLLTAAIDGLVARFGLAGAKGDEVVAGAVLKHTRDFNLTREAVLGSALSPNSPACDLQQACATGLEAVIYTSNKIRLGQAKVAIAGGTDSASDAPVVVTEGLRRAMLMAGRARSLPERLKAFAAVRPADLMPVPPAVVEPRTWLSMGESQALTTKRWEISREDQDQLSYDSHQNLARAWDEGFFDDLVTGYRGVARDTVLRPDTTLEKLASLKTVFGREDATMTAGNSTALTDGAAVVLVAEESVARERNWPVLAKVVDAQVAATDYVTGNEDLSSSPRPAPSPNYWSATSSPSTTSSCSSSTRPSPAPSSPRSRRSRRTAPAPSTDRSSTSTAPRSRPATRSQPPAAASSPASPSASPSAARARRASSPSAPPVGRAPS